MITTHNSATEKAILIGAGLSNASGELSIEDSLAELQRLADTAGLEVVAQLTQHLHQIDPNTFIGSGKVEELKQLLDETEVKTVIFDDELSPRHQRQLETILGSEIKVLDRSALILDIFAQHAHTKEGSLQVELAQLEYRLPRLTRMWTHLARQAGGGAARGGAGGVGLRGPGETQLEVDKREITRRITKLKQDIDTLQVQRDQKRKLREQHQVVTIAIVGYTNAGKSTLLRTLTGDDIYVADQLFATLDPVVRRVKLPSNRQVVFSDTVGFIQKLPTTLVAAFRSTLEEVRFADLLLHVADASHPHVLHHIETVEDVLAEIDVPSIPRILVWNKVDEVPSEGVPRWSESSNRLYAGQLQVSALKQIGVAELLSLIDRVIVSRHLHVKFKIPYERGDVLASLFQMATVENQEYTEDGVIVSALVLPTVFPLFSQYEWV
jgi:GTP-binding protein HflX